MITMNTIDRRKVYGIMLDTETANTIICEDGKLEMNFVLPYDFGFAVIDSKGNTYEKHSYVNDRQLKSTYEIRKIFCELCEKYECQFVVAHNARFDYRACNNIQRWTTKSKYRYFFPYGIEVWDTLKMARDVLGKMPTYIDFCFENGFVTKHKTPQPQYTAEVIYRYITKDIDFVEEHKGLEDVEIEIEIFKYLVRQHKPMRKNLFEKNKKISKKVLTNHQKCGIISM